MKGGGGADEAGEKNEEFQPVHVFLRQYKRKMKKLLTAGALLLLMFPVAQTQVCRPDKSTTAVGFNPDTIPYAEVGVAYSATIHAKTPKDTIVSFGGFPVKANIDSIKVMGVIGMPAGFTFRCDHPRCVFVYDSIGCGTFSGTPTQGGIYPLGVIVTTYARVGFPVTQRDTIRRFVLRVEPVPTTGQQKLYTESLRIYPNPARETAQVFIPQTFVNERIRVYNAAGREVMQQTAAAGQNLLDLKGLDAGVYVVVYGQWRNRLLVQP